MRRRELLAGAGCLAVAGTAFLLTPQRRLSRLGGAKFDQITPSRVGDWVSRDVSGLAPPSTADSLLAKLYDEVVERIYRSGSTGDEIMMLIAHGASQTTELQLHRPEVCYPAFGYRLTENQTVALPIAAGVRLPARRLTADAPGRREGVIYWTRIGDFLPTSDDTQRVARLQSAIEGFVCDGVLVRFSTLNPDAEKSFNLLERFVLDFLNAISATARPAFIGLKLAQQMVGAAPG